MSPRLIELVKRHEGYHRRIPGTDLVKPYICPAGFWTIAYGHVCDETAGPIGPDEANRILMADLEIAGRAVRRLVSVPLTEGQRGALSDFVFNLGAARLRASTLLRRLNRGDYAGVPDELRRWVIGGGRKLPGLIARREEDAALWLAG